MKTIGERIRQARQAKGWSGDELSKRCGYKSQSGISNLENRASGSGGNKIARIAQVLEVPIEWLINGPDTTEVPFSKSPHEQSPLMDGTLMWARAEESLATEDPARCSEPEGPFLARLPAAKADRQSAELLDLFSQLDQEGKAECLGMVRTLVVIRRPHTHGQDPRLAKR